MLGVDNYELIVASECIHSDIRESETNIKSRIAEVYLAIIA